MSVEEEPTALSEEEPASRSEEKPASLTEAQVNVLYTRGLIGRETWSLVLRMHRGSPHPAGPLALRTCEVAIESLVERAVDAACAVIQDKLGVKTGDLAAAVLSDGTIERELTRYVLAELAAVDDDGMTEPIAVDGEAAATAELAESEGSVQP